eukprot:6182759-Pleurochrysis_carterae.AAC.2
MTLRRQFFALCARVDAGAARLRQSLPNGGLSLDAGQTRGAVGRGPAISTYHHPGGSCATCAIEWTASLLARRQLASQAILRAMSAQVLGSSRVHCGSRRRTSARRLPCVTTAGDATALAAGFGTTSTPTLSNETVSPVGSVSEEYQLDAYK